MQYATTTIPYLFSFLQKISSDDEKKFLSFLISATGDSTLSKKSSGSPRK
ncbi:MAG: hypothetical protein FWE23_06205 [Chitinivibrionia bacterium]|nr:hypothetical protein [Chitinivibrionia bacterium]